MTFKREISIDGVAVIVAAVGCIVWLVTMHITQNSQGETLNEHTLELRQMSATEASLAVSVSVLTAVVNERTGHSINLSPRSAGN
jgi:uncharacterized protein YoxC